MEGSEAAAGLSRPSTGERINEFARAHARSLSLGALLLVTIAIVLLKGTHDVAQSVVDGLSLGSIYALGAVGLTLVYGILKLVNFAQGDFLTFGAYMAFLVNVTWNLPLVIGIPFAMFMTALLALFFEVIMWRPMRRRGAGLLQLLLMSIGLAFFIRSVIQFFWGTQIRKLDVDNLSSVTFLGLRVGQTELIIIIIGVVVLSAVGLGLRYSLLGKRMRAISDDIDLAETAGIDTQRVIYLTWIFAGALAGLAGVLYGATTNVKPELGFEVLLPLFAAVVLGGIGDAFGALIAGLFLGIVIQSSTLFLPDEWKTTIGFLFLILALVVRPSGIFGKAKAV